MAIEFAIPRFVSRSKGDSAVHTAAYNMRVPLYDERTGEIDRRWDQSTHVSHDIDLPPTAGEEYKTAGPLWNHVEAAEGRIDSQVAFEVVVALDPTLTDAERRAQAREFARECFVDHGFAAQTDVHRPHPSKAIDEHSNYHAHILVPTRPFDGHQLARTKPRDFFVKVKTAYGKPYVPIKNKWGPLWRDFQNAWFAQHGKPIVVDPVAPVPGRHIGPQRFRHPADPRIAENRRRQEMNSTIARDPQSAAKHLSKQRIYRGTGVERFFEKLVADPELRKLVQAEALPKLAAIQHAALLKASQTDLTGAGGPITLEYVARGLSPKLDAVLWETSDLREKARANDYRIRQSIEGIEQGKSRVEQRKETISRPRKLLHDALGLSDYLLKHWGDAALNQGVNQQARSEGWGKKLKFEQKRIADRLAALRPQAAALLEEVRPKAQRELEVRRRIARNARAELQTIEKADRTLRVRRTPTLRP